MRYSTKTVSILSGILLKSKTEHKILFLHFLSVFSIICSLFFTPPRNRGGVIFLLQFVCVSVCLSVCVCARLFFCEQNSSRMDTPIWTRFSQNNCFLHWLGPYWILWPWVKGQGHNDVISIFIHYSLLTSLPCISTLFRLIKMKFDMSLRYTLGRFVFKFHKIRMEDDVIITSYPNYEI